MTEKKSTKEKKPRAKRVHFELDAPEAKEVAVTGSFCDWDDRYDLKRREGGRWKRTMNLPPGRHEYRFIVDGEWRDDPRSPERVPNPYGGLNSVLEL